MSFEVEIFADRIFVFKNILDDPAEAVYMMDNMDDMLTDSDVFHKSEPWLASADPDGHTYGIKRMSSIEKLSTSSDKIKEFYNKLDAAFITAGKYYFEKLGIEYKDEYYVNLAMFKYDTGKDMGAHVDNDDDGIVQPICTGLLYLNSDKEGGDLYFKEQDVFVKTEAGTMVLFPCVKPYYHESTMIKSGLKYSAGAGWKIPIR